MNSILGRYCGKGLSGLPTWVLFELSRVEDIVKNIRLLALFPISKAGKSTGLEIGLGNGQHLPSTDFS